MYSYYVGVKVNTSEKIIIFADKTQTFFRDVFTYLVIYLFYLVIYLFVNQAWYVLINIFIKYIEI